MAQAEQRVDLDDPKGWHLSALLLLTLVVPAGPVALLGAWWTAFSLLPWVRGNGWPLVLLATGLAVTGLCWTAAVAVGATARWRGGNRLRLGLGLVAAGGLPPAAVVLVMVWRFWPCLVGGEPWPRLRASEGAIPITVTIATLFAMAAATVALGGGTRLRRLPPRVRRRQRAPEGIRVVRYVDAGAVRPLWLAAGIGAAVASLHWLMPADPPPVPRDWIAGRPVQAWVERLQDPRTRTPAAERLESAGDAALPVWSALARAEESPEHTRRRKGLELIGKAAPYLLRDPSSVEWNAALDGSDQWVRVAAMGLEHCVRAHQCEPEELTELVLPLRYRAPWLDAVCTAMTRGGLEVEDAVFDGGERGSNPHAWYQLLCYARGAPGLRARVDALVREMSWSADSDLRDYARRLLPRLGERAWPYLLEQLRSEDQSERRAAAETCTQLDRINAALLAELRTMSRDLDAEVAGAALAAIVKHCPRDDRAWKRFIDGLYRHSYASETELRTLLDTAEAVPERWPDALAIGPRNVWSWAELLAERESIQSQREFRRLVVQGCIYLPSLIQRLPRHRCPNGEWLIARRLAQPRGHGWVTAAHAAARLLVASDEVYRALRDGLADPGAEFRLAAARALVVQRRHEPSVRAMLRAVADDDPDPLVRAAALAGLGRLEGNYTEAATFIRPRLGGDEQAWITSMAGVVAWHPELCRMLEPELRREARRANGFFVHDVDAALRRAYYPSRCGAETELHGEWRY